MQICPLNVKRCSSYSFYRVLTIVSSLLVALRGLAGTVFLQELVCVQAEDQAHH